MRKRREKTGKTLVQRLLAAFGAAGLLGAAAPATAVISPERAQLEARVAQIRSDIARAPGEAVAPTLVAAANWNNWPKWDKWAKWANG